VPSSTLVGLALFAAATLAAVVIPSHPTPDATTHAPTVPPTPRVYINNCSEFNTTGNCVKSSEPYGCYPWAGGDNLVQQVRCLPPSDEHLCAFLGGQAVERCSPWGYCQEGYGSESNGMKYICNATSQEFLVEECQDYACITCRQADPRTYAHPRHRVSKLTEQTVRPCGWIIGFQLFYPVCDTSDPLAFGAGPLTWYKSPYIDGDVAYSCTPFEGQP